MWINIFEDLGEVWFSITVLFGVFNLVAFNPLANGFKGCPLSFNTAGLVIMAVSSCLISSVLPLYYFKNAA